MAISYYATLKHFLDSLTPDPWTVTPDPRIVLPQFSYFFDFVLKRKWTYEKRFWRVVHLRSPLFFGGPKYSVVWGPGVAIFHEVLKLYSTDVVKKINGSVQSHMDYHIK